MRPQAGDLDLVFLPFPQVKGKIFQSPNLGRGKKVRLWGWAAERGKRVGSGDKFPSACYQFCYQSPFENGVFRRNSLCALPKCQGGGLNSRPRAYESPALPLSYPGVTFRAAEITGFAPRGKCGVHPIFSRRDGYFAGGFAAAFAIISFTRSSIAAACLPSSEAASIAFTSPISLRTVSLSCGGR
jgi:hypothetical protein